VAVNRIGRVSSHAADPGPPIAGKSVELELQIRETRGNLRRWLTVGPRMPRHAMSPNEVRAFLSSPPRPGVLATAGPGGRPHAAPVWFDLDGDTIVFNTGAATVKGRNLANNPQATLVVQDDRPPFSFVMIEGTVELISDLDEVRSWAARLGGRYMGTNKADAYGARNGVPG